jgi:hypothetical protein
MCIRIYYRQLASLRRYRWTARKRRQRNEPIQSRRRRGRGEPSPARELRGGAGDWLTMGDVPHECELSYPTRHALQRSACAPSNAKPDVPERPISPGADVGGGSPVPAQMCACLRGRVRVPVQLGVQPQQQRPFGEGECLRLLRVRGCVGVGGRSHARMRACACVHGSLCVHLSVVACVCVCVCARARA